MSVHGPKKPLHSYAWIDPATRSRCIAAVESKAALGRMMGWAESQLRYVVLTRDPREQAAARKQPGVVLRRPLADLEADFTA